MRRLTRWGLFGMLDVSSSAFGKPLWDFLSMAIGVLTYLRSTTCHVLSNPPLSSHLICFRWKYRISKDEIGWGISTFIDFIPKYKQLYVLY